MNMRRHPRPLAALFAAALFAVACAEEQPPIDRVQPNYFDKSFFVGQNLLDTQDDPEFYAQGTLVDVGYGAAQDGLFTSTYAQPLNRVKWSITEDMLIARLAYERIRGSDGKGAGKATNDGIVVAAYRILKHFDVQRSYNPATGERYNVVEENSVDRPWFERQYMRVDWSRNMNTDNYEFDTLSQLGIYGGVSYEPLSYYVNDPSHEDAPVFVPDQGYLDITTKAFARPQLIDISSFGWGLSVVPACWFDADFMGGPGPSAMCSPVELTIRHSFHKVPQSDYEPANWDGHRFQAFGAFYTERKGYARNYGMTDTQWHRFINRYDIWERHHKYEDPQNMVGAVACYTPATTPAGEDPNRDADGNGTADECESVGGGSRCDTFSQKCTLPYRERTPKPVVTYYSNGSHADYYEPSEESVHEWDVALRSAVMTARYAECVKVGEENCRQKWPVYYGQQDENHDALQLAREVDSCRRGKAYQGRDCNALADALGTERGYTRGVVELAKLPEMMVLCHSPVQADDHASCGSAADRLPSGITARMCKEARADGSDKALIETCGKALNVRKGDLRFHAVNVIETPQTPSPWGIMVDAVDPLTGRTVSGSANVWSHVNDSWSQGIVDTARYIKGELSTSDVTEGTYVQDWAAAADAASRNGAAPQLSKAEVSDRIRQFAKGHISAEGAGGNANGGAKLEKVEELSPQLKKTLREVRRQLNGIRADAYAPSVSQPLYQQRRERALGSKTEAALVTPMMQARAGTSVLTDISSIMQFASPMRGASPHIQRDFERRREIGYADRGACVLHEAPAPFAMADLSDLLEAKFGAFNPADPKDTQLARAEKMRRYLAHKAHYAVMTHELGHSIGLRHNFVSSSDAWNYRPQYWQLRTDNGENSTPCTDVSPDGSCVGPRYLDPVNDNEKKNVITMFMQSSSMEYPGEAMQEFLGTGAYDFAATRMFYGDVAPVFFDSSFNVGQPASLGPLDKMDGFGGILGFQPTVKDESSQAFTDTRDIHYSELQQHYSLIGNCREIDPLKFKPANWDESKMGVWHPLLDGLIVEVGGKYTRCSQQPVDYVFWDQLRNPTASETGNTLGGPSVDKTGRVRFPYGFATDRWADLGNVAVYRGDNGADPYELFDFYMSQMEVNHIFDNYRRNRHTFTVRGASGRTMARYNEKLRDAAKGLGLMATIYRDFAYDAGYDFDTLWPVISRDFFGPNIIASGIGFDFFARQMVRPQSGPHYLAPSPTGENGVPVLRSTADALLSNPGTIRVNVPNGATGQFRNVNAGGRLLENQLASDKGEYDAEYTINAGSYYDKAFMSMLMTESVDNFISDSRRDFLDSRYRAVSMADLFPDGYRRWLANNLTGDEFLKGARIEATAQGAPLVDAQLFPQRGLGWPSWWKETPEVCFPSETNIRCDATAANSIPVESQVGWEQQKFLIAWTLMYLPENQMQTWLNQMNIWELGADTDPGFPNRIELHLPNGKTYIARTFGKETLFGQTVQKGISARILEYANGLLRRAYVTTDGPDLDNDGQPDWFIPVMGPNGQPQVRYDPTVQWVDGEGFIQPTPRPTCNPTNSTGCTCSSNKACVDLSKYDQVPTFMRQAMADYGMADPTMKGVY